ncbi:MAG: hypothetical protein K9K64_16440 [Desulfohalobiaceae bacterium]|nr:hypothetical protein [Desulfohalobiaceae bacterium]
MPIQEPHHLFEDLQPGFEILDDLLGQGVGVSGGFCRSAGLPSLIQKISRLF